MEDESFDVVLSVFGCMFAPRHEVAAREIELLEPQGLWPALAEDLASVYERQNTLSGPEVAYGAEYLVVLGRKQS